MTVKDQEQFMEIAKTIIPRRPYHDDKPLSYLESDDDFYENNQDAAIKLLELAARLAVKK